MIGHSLGPSIMMQLGRYQFSLSTAAYQELTRKTEYRWPSQDAFGKIPARQFTGKGADTMTIGGTIYPDYRGGFGQIDSMREEAGKGLPLLLIDGSGKAFGSWVIEGIEEKQGTFAAAGMPRRQDFTLSLALFAEPEPVAMPFLAAISGLEQPKSGLASVIDKATSAVGGAVASVNSALAAVQAKAAEYGSAIGPVIAGANNALRAAKNLQAGIESAKGAIASAGSLQGAQSAIYSLSGLAGAASNAGAIASSAAGALSTATPVIGAGAKAAMRGLEAATGTLTKAVAAAPASIASAVESVEKWQ